MKQLSQLGIGTSRVGSLGSRLSPDYFGAMVSVAAENKINLIDTADAYGSGDAERLIGHCIRHNPSAYFIITKAGIPNVDTPGWLSPLNQIGKKLKEKAGVKKNFTARYLLASLEKSNRRLGLKQVDAFMLHEPAYHHLADDSWAGLEKIRQSGMARYTGVSTNDYQVVEAGIRAGQIQESRNINRLEQSIDRCPHRPLPEASDSGGSQQCIAGLQRPEQSVCAAGPRLFIN